jgi:hypothetical protein
MIAQLVYLLCGLTSAGCAFLLLKGYRDNRIRLLFWSGMCFLFLALSNILLFIDLVIVPEIDLSVYRSGITLIGLGMLVYGLIWETS